MVQRVGYHVLRTYTTLVALSFFFVHALKNQIAPYFKYTSYHFSCLLGSHVSPSLWMFLLPHGCFACLMDASPALWMFLLPFSIACFSCLLDVSPCLVGFNWSASLGCPSGCFSLPCRIQLVCIFRLPFWMFLLAL